MSVNANVDSNTTNIKLLIYIIQTENQEHEYSWSFIYVKLNRLIATNAIFIFELQFRRMTKNTTKKKKEYYMLH